MRSLKVVSAVLVAALGVGVAVALAATTGTVSVCATSPGHTIGVDGKAVATIPGASKCVTSTYTVPTVTATVTTTVSGPTTTVATTTQATTTTSTSALPMPFYVDTGSDYSSGARDTAWDALVAAGMPSAAGMLCPLDTTVINHVGVSGQWCLIPSGYTDAQIQQYAVPAWQTGKVAGFVIYDEPSASQASQIAALNQYVKSLMPGVKTAVTGYDPGTLTTLAQAGAADIYLIDNYPARTGWDLSGVKACVSALAGYQYGIVLDAFQATNYPLPTPAQLQSEINYALSTKAVMLPVYEWPVDSSLQAVLAQYK